LSYPLKKNKNIFNEWKPPLSLTTNIIREEGGSKKNQSHKKQTELAIIHRRLISTCWNNPVVSFTTTSQKPYVELKNQTVFNNYLKHNNKPFNSVSFFNCIIYFLSFFLCYYYIFQVLMIVEKNSTNCCSGDAC
jgi:hypothetical protein